MAESDLQSHKFLPTKNKQVIVMNTVLTRFPPFLSFTLLLCDGVLNFLMQIFKRDKKINRLPWGTWSSFLDPLLWLLHLGWKTQERVPGDEVRDILESTCAMTTQRVKEEHYKSAHLLCRKKKFCTLCISRSCFFRFCSALSPSGDQCR